MMWAACLAAQVGLVLVSEGRPVASIVIPASPSASVRHAAQELREHLEQMSGASLEVRTDDLPSRGVEVLIGPTSREESRAVVGEISALPPDGYLVRTVGDKLVLAGTEPRGSLYAVYGLLEDHLGVRWFTREVTHVPKRSTVGLPLLDDVQRPPLEYREPFVYDGFDGDWAARNRCNSSAARLEPKHGGKVRFGAGWFVHTFNRLVPPEEFFDEHPEYFSLVDGRRLKDGSQLCTTNPDVIRIVTERLLQGIAEDPEATVFSVSQNDWYNPCQCDRCQAVANREGSQIGPVLELVNHVADEVAKRYPDKLVETLAYQWTRKAPKHLRPRPNVIVRLCSIECCFSHPLDGCDSAANREFLADLQAWSTVSDRLWVWDYVTSFHHYYTPFPNLGVRAPNIRSFVENHVKGMFEQDVYQTPHGEFSKLSGYLGAKLLWDPTRDPEKVIDEFLAGVYGAGAAPIRRWIDAMHDHVERNNVHMNIWVGPKDAHLTDDLLAQGEGWFDEAERAVADQPEVLTRVRRARLSVDYALVERSRVKGVGPGGMFVEFDGNLQPEPLFERRFERFVRNGKEAGIVTLREGSFPLEDYEARVRAAFAQAREPHLARSAPVSLVHPASPKYPTAGPLVLTDGLRGSLDYADGAWMGFDRDPMIATLDLGRVQPIGSVSVGFLEAAYAWVFLPERVLVETSVDGSSWQAVGEAGLELPEAMRSPNVVDVKLEAGGREARFVRVTTAPRASGPAWHLSHQNPVWIFVDEIVVLPPSAGGFLRTEGQDMVQLE